MSSSDKCYPGIKYCEIVKDWRKKTHLDHDPHCLLFVFENILIPLSPMDIYQALTGKYGEDTLDGMRTVHTTSETRMQNTYYTVVVEAHFSSIQKWKDAFKESLTSEQIGKVSVQFFKGGETFWIKVMQPLPPVSPSLSVFTFNGLPLGSYLSLVENIKLFVAARFVKSRAGRSILKPGIVVSNKDLVDISPGLFANKYFNGSLSAIVKDVVNGSIDFRLEAFGKDHMPSRYGKHYLYCKNCRYLDSHAGEDCPLPKRD